MKPSNRRTGTRRGSARQHRWAAGLVGLCLVALTPLAEAGEGGLSNFPYGAQTTYAAFLPPPGTTSFYGYALGYTADRFRDSDGDRVPGVEVDVYALAPRLVHTWKQGLGGFNISSGLVLQGLRAKVKAGGMEDTRTGPSLLGIEPFYFTRSVGAWQFLAGPLFYVPLGNYDPNRLANSTVNYRSYAFQQSTTWMPTPRWELSLNNAIEFKARNSKTGYRSGTQAGATFGAGYRPFENNLKWDVGISGFYTRQLQDDRINGDRVPSGGRTRKFGIGPKVAYWFTPASAVIVQWHRESGVRNAAQGDLLWVMCAFPLF